MVLCCCCHSKQRILYLDQMKIIYSKAEEYKEGPNGTVDPSQIDMEALEQFVNKQSKPIIDYLENNQRRLKDIAKHVFRKVKGTSNSGSHLISLFILNNVLLACRKLQYDEKYLSKLMKKKKNKQQTFINYLLHKYHSRNFSEFERRLLSIVTYLLGNKIPNSHLIFPNVVKTIIVYGKSLPKGQMNKSSKSQHLDLVKNILDEEKLVRKLDSPQDWEDQLNILEGLQSLTAKKEEVIFQASIKMSLINIVYNLLKVIFGGKQASDVAETASKMKDYCFQILADLTNTDFNLFEHDFTFLEVMRRSNEDNWLYSQLIQAYIEIFSREKNSNRNKSKIEGCILDNLIKMLKEKKITNSSPETGSPSGSVELKGEGQHTVMLVLVDLLSNGSEYMFSYYYIEVITRTLCELYFKIETPSSMIASIDDVFLTIGVKLKEFVITVFEKYFICLFRELASAIEMGNYSLDSRITSFLALYDRILLSLGCMKPGYIISETLQKTSSICFQSVFKRQERTRLLLSMMRTQALLYSMKYEELRSEDVCLVFAEGKAVQEILLMTLNGLKITACEIFQLTSMQKVEIKDQDVVYQIKLSFNILTQIISRGNIDDVMSLVSFFKEYKETLIDENPRWKLGVLNSIFWAYSVYLFAMKWDIVPLGTLISEKYEDLLSSEACRGLLRLLIDTKYDPAELQNAALILNQEKVKIPYKIPKAKVLELIQDHFQKYDLNEDKLGGPLEKVGLDVSRVNISAYSANQVLDSSLDDSKNKIITSNHYDVVSLADNQSEQSRDLIINDISVEIDDFNNYKKKEDEFWAKLMPSTHSEIDQQNILNSPSMALSFRKIDTFNCQEQLEQIN